MDKVTLALVKSKVNSATANGGEESSFPTPAFLKTNDDKRLEEAREKQKKKLQKSQKKRSAEREKNRNKYREKYGLKSEGRETNDKRSEQVSSNGDVLGNVADFGRVSSDMSKHKQEETKCLVM